MHIPERSQRGRLCTQRVYIFLFVEFLKSRPEIFKLKPHDELGKYKIEMTSEFATTTSALQIQQQQQIQPLPQNESNVKSEALDNDLVEKINSILISAAAQSMKSKGKPANASSVYSEILQKKNLTPYGLSKSVVEKVFSKFCGESSGENPKFSRFLAFLGSQNGTFELKGSRSDNDLEIVLKDSVEKEGNTNKNIGKKNVTFDGENSEKHSTIDQYFDELREIVAHSMQGGSRTVVGGTVR